MHLPLEEARDFPLFLVLLLLELLQFSLEPKFRRLRRWIVYFLLLRHQRPIIYSVTIIPFSSNFTFQESVFAKAELLFSPAVVEFEVLFVPALDLKRPLPDFLKEG